MQHLQKTRRVGSPRAILHSNPPPILRTFFQVPYPVTPLFTTLTKTPGCGCILPILERAVSPSHSVLISLPHYLVTSLLHHRRRPARPLQHGSRRVGFFADVAHTNDARWVPDPRRTRDVPDFFAVESEERIRFGHGVAGKSQLDALAVDLAARAHALDDFLAGVAAFGVTDVAVLQARLVGGLFFAEVVAEPGDAFGEAGWASSPVFPHRCFLPADR